MFSPGGFVLFTQLLWAIQPSLDCKDYCQIQILPESSGQLFSSYLRRVLLERTTIPLPFRITSLWLASGLCLVTTMALESQSTFAFPIKIAINNKTSIGKSKL
jgi:hypothetical protein